MHGSAPRRLETFPVSLDAAQRAVIEAARRVARCRWQEFQDPISTSRRNLIQLTLAVADLDSFGAPGADSSISLAR